MLARLAAGDVACVVVGMAAGIIGGVPLPTEDIDIVPLRSAENLGRLLVVLRDIDAVPRPPGGQLDDLLEPADRSFDTACGPVDVYAAIDGGKTYADLVPISRGVTHIDHCHGGVCIGHDYEPPRPLVAARTDHPPLRVLELEALGDMKRRSARVKDQVDLEYIEMTLLERPAVVFRLPEGGDELLE